jgi:hypothetical protein
MCILVIIEEYLSAFLFETYYGLATGIIDSRDYEMDDYCWGLPYTLISYCVPVFTVGD